MNKGLLYKDFFEIKNFAHLIVFLFLIIVEPKIITPIVMLYACFLIYTIFEIDSKNKFDIMLHTMPIKSRDFVLSRYLIGFFLCAVIGIWTAAIPFVYSIISRKNVDIGATIEIAKNSLFIACIFQSIMLPVVIKFGVIKSKLYLIGATAVVAIAFIMFSKYYNLSIQHITSIRIYSLMLSVSIVLLMSMLVSYLAKKI